MTDEHTGTMTDPSGRAAKPLCIVCKSTINAGAKKCLKCGARQDWLRFLDVGNTSLSLFIAAISVLALGADNIVRLLDWFADKELADFSVQIARAHPTAVTLTIDNDGPGSVAFAGTVLCDVYQTATERELNVPSSDDPKRYFTSRYPKPQEVVARTVFLYGDEEHAEIFTPGTFKQITLPFKDISKQLFSLHDLKALSEVKSNCSTFYHHENGALDAFADSISVVDVPWFAMDQEDVRAAFAAWDARVQRKN
ncbi:hypothetical protein [Sinorhizobium meliloti]|uniref:hypothetical protein n=1 Tax=Rhizobium meliloti TaxID=382 RepID=UPI00299EF306|nr:hypothetical protein [Sinorhizobium meliloti]